MTRRSTCSTSEAILQDVDAQLNIRAVAQKSEAAKLEQNKQMLLIGIVACVVIFVIIAIAYMIWGESFLGLIELIVIIAAIWFFKQRKGNKGKEGLTMGGYRVRSDETKILTCTQVRRYGDDREQACVELTLTNRNLIYVWQIRRCSVKGRSMRMCTRYPGLKGAGWGRAGEIRGKERPCGIGSAFRPG